MYLLMLFIQLKLPNKIQYNKIVFKIIKLSFICQPNRNIIMDSLHSMFNVYRENYPSWMFN